jgi:hypothetical protein
MLAFRVLVTLLLLRPLLHTKQSEATLVQPQRPLYRGQLNLQLAARLMQQQFRQPSKEQ